MKYKTSGDKETICEKCPHRATKTRLEDIEGSYSILPWVSHLFYLDGLNRVGATFHINDLHKCEWDGLVLIESARIELEKERMEKADEKAKLQKAMQGAQPRSTIRH